MRRNITVITSLLAIVVGMSGFQQEQQDDQPINLKVLPKSISHAELDSTMKSFNVALGVKCGHCHAAKPHGERGLDFASDENPKKNVARAMIKMTNKINKKHFKYEHDGVLRNISCKTCHNGQDEPFTVVNN
ncbi:MAG: c-type cytochrome [Sphingobacterium sp.]|uniref:c-type cytochrome n=1 Tax=Sphingobacterium sp. JB170 TaxID=1434842 RepID=UPI00097ECB37|nr:c-type cytochrome [Sphingobacterium sp. JB170]SJN48867.1 hypothetical protein FM107_17805 [Sphingobacterium sp. JB170]